MTPQNDRVPFAVSAESVEACNCKHGCNCQFAGFPNEGKCEFIIGYQVVRGQFGDVSLNGMTAVVAAKYPGAIHEGNGHVVLFVSDTATEQQAQAFTSILSGKMGGMPWEALAGTISRFDGPIRQPVHVTLNGERSEVRVPGAIDLHLTPLVNPVTGEEKEVHITYPKGGFFWDDARIATSETMRARHGDFALEWPNRYASVATVNWTNASRS